MKVIKEAIEDIPVSKEEILNAVADVENAYDQLRDMIYVLDNLAPKYKLETLIWRLEDEFGASMFGDLDDIKNDLKEPVEESAKVQQVGDGWYTTKEEALEESESSPKIELDKVDAKDARRAKEPILAYRNRLQKLGYSNAVINADISQYTDGDNYADLPESLQEETSSYKIGDTIKIIEMTGEPHYAGKTGVIEDIDGIGQLHGTWGGLAVIPGEDKFEVISKVEEGLDGDKTEYDNGRKCPSCGKNSVFEIEGTEDSKGDPIWQCQNCGAELVRRGFLGNKFKKPTYKGKE